MHVLENITKNTHYWLSGYIWQRLGRRQGPKNQTPTTIFLSLCDHFEPLWKNADRETALTRLTQWAEKYPKIAGKYKDAEGQHPKHTFFYPIEEYSKEYLDILSELCLSGYGETEIHLHHDNDTSANLRQSILKFKGTLADTHGLLSRHKHTKEITYGFIHGNWALDNSRPDGRWCGVNDELTVLKETGCYADLTLPSAPDSTQTAKINSIYYAYDDPLSPKSHNTGVEAKTGSQNRKGLLIVQGPLMLNWKQRKAGILPRIENSNISYDSPVTLERIKLWIDAHIHVKNKPEYIFIKLHTHGCQENNIRYLLSNGLNDLFSLFNEHYNDGSTYRLFYTTARETVNIIKALEDSQAADNPGIFKDYLYIRNASAHL